MGCKRLEENFLKVVLGGKATGDGDDVFVNAEFSGGQTNTQNFTVYVNPYMVINHKGEYTKHYYVGSQRILTKMGDGTTYDSEDPRRTPKAGFTVDEEHELDYDQKQTEANNTVANKYKDLGVPYAGLNNEEQYPDYCPGCSSTSSLNSSLTTAALINPEKDMYFYHPDHLGSSSYISYTDGEIVQHNEYVPFGEVLLEDRNNARSYATPYLFNGKELDEETSLYYFSQRYMDPKVPGFLTIDPLWEKHPNRSPYEYAFNNPLKYVDPTGMEGEDWVEDKKGNIYWKDNVTSKNDSDLDKSKGEKWRGKTEATCQGSTCHNFRSDGTIEKNTYNSKTGKNSSQILENGASSISGGDTYTSRGQENENLRTTFEALEITGAATEIASIVGIPYTGVSVLGLPVGFVLSTTGTFGNISLDINERKTGSAITRFGIWGATLGIGSGIKAVTTHGSLDAKILEGLNFGFDQVMGITREQSSKQNQTNFRPINPSRY